MLKFHCCEHVILTGFSYNRLYRLGGAKMAKCEICGKGVHFGNNVSHSHRRSNRIWNSNIKKVKCNVNGAAKRIYVCTRCLRANKVERA